jgi:hypothetical protein
LLLLILQKLFFNCHWLIVLPDISYCLIFGPVAGLSIDFSSGGCQGLDHRRIEERLEGSVPREGTVLTSSTSRMLRFACHW